MRVKLRRGPYKGQVKEFDAKYGLDRINVQMPQYDDYYRHAWDGYTEPMAALTMKRGHYQKTNVKTSRGIPIFEWMGWEGEVSG